MLQVCSSLLFPCDSNMLLFCIACFTETNCYADPDFLQSERRGQAGTRANQQFSRWVVVPPVYNVVIALSLCCWQRRVFPFYYPSINFLPFCLPVRELCTLVGFCPLSLPYCIVAGSKLMTCIQFCQNVFIQRCILHLEDKQSFQPPAHLRQQISVLYPYRVIHQCKLFIFV
jgi:hypothetical protein